MIEKKQEYSFFQKIELPGDQNKRGKLPNLILNSSLEKIVINGLRNGDCKAFSNIFSAYYKDLVIFAARFTKEIHTAEEIVEDVFVNIWEERESINIDSSLKSYLLKSVQNKCIDLVRHKKIIQAHNEYSLLNSPRLTTNADTYLLYSELTEQIETALKLIPEEISGAYRMSREKGLKYRQIAEILGVSIRTVEVRVGKALSLLRYHLKDYLTVIIIVALLLDQINFNMILFFLKQQ